MPTVGFDGRAQVASATHHVYRGVTKDAAEVLNIRGLASTIKRPLRGPQYDASAESFQPWRAKADRAREGLLDRLPQSPPERPLS